MVHLFRIELVAVLAAPLDVVHRDIGVLDQHLFRLARLRVQGDPDAGAHEQLVPVDHERRVQAVQDLGGDHDHIVLRAYLGQQQGELIPAKAGQGVAPAQAALQALGHGLEQPVAHGVAERVVHDLETVQIEEHDPQLALVAPRVGDGHGQSVFQQHAVGQVRQQVVVGLKIDDPFGFLALGDIAGRAVGACKVFPGALFRIRIDPHGGQFHPQRLRGAAIPLPGDLAL